jgi:hypothetical protein
MRSAIPAILFAGCVISPAFGQPKARPYGEETYAFRGVLSALHVEPPPPANDLLDRPQNRILIVFGRTEVLDPMLDGRLKEFIEAGGAVMIATDRRTSDRLFQEIGVRISGVSVTTLPAADLAYRNMPECPFVWEFGQIKANGGPRAGFLFQGLGIEPRVATNLPSAIAGSTNIIPAATLRAPGHSFSLAGLRDFRVSVDGQSLFAVVGNPLTWKKGRLLVLADHSIFINDMMLQADTDNIRFAFNAVRWLADAGNGQRRTTVVFLDDGEFQADFNVSLDYPPPPDMPLVPLANEIIIGLERENAFNNMLFEMTGGPTPVLRTTALVLTLGLLLLGLYRFLQGRYRPDARAPKLPCRLDALTAAVPTVERRHQAVIAQGNLAEAARELAHQAFAAVGLTPSADAPPPAVSVSGWAPFRAWRWGREVRSLWSMAARGPVRRVSPAALQQLDVTLHNLLAAVAAGQVRLAAAKSAV